MLTVFAPTACLFVLSVYFLHLLTLSLRRLYTRRIHGCHPASHLPQSWWRFGADVQAQMTAVKASGGVTRSFQSLFDNYGHTFQAAVWGQPWLWTCDVENIKAINTTSFSAFAVEPLRKPANAGWMGDGIFVSDGEHWRASRSLFKPLFARNGTTHLCALQRQINVLFDVLPANGETVDLQKFFRKMYFDISFEYLLGASPGALRQNGVSAIDVDRFHSAFEIATVGMSRRHALGRAFRWADHSEKAWRDACTYVHEIFDKYIDTAIRIHEAECNEDGFEGRRDDDSNDEQPKEDQHISTSMLDSLVQLTQDRAFLRDQLLNVFLGAKDTATIGISDIFFNLARHPDVWHTLRNEVALSIKPNQTLNFDTVMALPFLRNVIKESLRLLSPVDMMSRFCVQDTILPQGGGPNGDDPLFVYRGTRIEARISPMHRNKQFWGEDAEEFIPERWNQWRGKMDTNNVEVLADREERRSNKTRPPRWEYVPFLGGGRMCPAREMSLTQYAILLVLFAQRFVRIENRDPELRFIEQIKFGKQSANGVLVGLIQE